MVDNWYLFVALGCILTLVVACVIKFLRLPSADKIENIKEWLKWAVVQAEKELGSGTGQLKLRLVYDWFVNTFPDIAKFITFETFSGWVDEALEWMRHQLESNDAVKCYVSTEV